MVSTKGPTISSVFIVVILIKSVHLLEIFPQITGCTANIHVLPLIGTSVQVTVVWLIGASGAAATV